MVLLFFNFRNMLRTAMLPLETSFYVPETDAIFAAMVPEQEAGRLSRRLETFDCAIEEDCRLNQGGWAHIHGVAHEGETDHDVDILISFPGMFRRGLARLHHREPMAIVHLTMD